MDGPTIARGHRGRAARRRAGARRRSTAVEAISNAGGRAVVMTYWNPVLHYGVDAFARDLAAAGGLGLITPDLIPDEADDWIAASDAARPRTGSSWWRRRRRRERLATTVEASRGFVYAASTMGVTGARDAVSSRHRNWSRGSGRISDIPVGVGLGVRSRRAGRRDRRPTPTASSSVRRWSRRWMRGWTRCAP